MEHAVPGLYYDYHGGMVVVPVDKYQVTPRPFRAVLLARAR